MRCFVLARNGEILGLSISTSCPLQDAQLGGGGPSGTSSRHVRLHCGFSACSWHRICPGKQRAVPILIPIDSQVVEWRSLWRWACAQMGGQQQWRVLGLHGVDGYLLQSCASFWLWPGSAALAQLMAGACVFVCLFVPRLSCDHVHKGCLERLWLPVFEEMSLPVPMNSSSTSKPPL